MEKKDGVYEEYHEDGWLKRKETYKNGMKEGVRKHYYNHGQ